MATFSAFTPTDPDAPAGGRRLPPRAGHLRDSGGVTTYCFRRTDGTRGTATDLSSIPAGADIERTVRS